MRPAPSRRLLLALLAAGWTRAAAAQEPKRSPLEALADGEVVALIRHTSAPGEGDPPGFRLGDCATQRNLSDAGRLEAAELGRRLRAASVLVTSIRSSRWCRAQDTAALAFPGRGIVPDASLDSFLDAPSAGPRQTEQIGRTIESWRGRQGVLALVTHAVNIKALTGISAAAGEIVALRPTVVGFDILGTITLSGAAPSR